eukprot:gene9305-11022_t
MWMVGGGGILSDSAEGITVDRDGDVYIAGNFVKAATFGEHYLLTKQGKSSDTDIFVAKIWKTGSFDYALGVGGTGIDYANGIKVTGPAAGGHSLFVAGGSLERSTGCGGLWDRIGGLRWTVGSDRRAAADCGIGSEEPWRPLSAGMASVSPSASASLL